jgi:hypothetical protein
MAGRCCCERPIEELSCWGGFSQCFLDGSNPVLVEHRIEEMLAQRVYGLALGYEDLNDHEQLRHDPLLQVLAGKAERAKRRWRARAR